MPDHGERECAAWSLPRRRTIRHVLGAFFICAASFTAAAQEPADQDRHRGVALEALNADRERNGLGPLGLGEALNRAAATHAEDMLKRNFYAHTSPEGETVQDRYVAAGGSRWELVAENIARCVGCSLSADMVRKLQQDWMESPEHRRNILARGLERFGFGIVLGDDGTLYAVQTFAGPGVAQNLAEGESAQPVKGKQAAGIMLDKINAVRRQSGASPLRLSETLSTAASALLPESDDEPFAVRAEGGLYDALPDDRPRQWRRLATASGACGGCGREPARSDVAAFADNWLEDPGIRRSLLDENLTHLGFDITANGEGKKLAVAVLGEYQ